MSHVGGFFHTCPIRPIASTVDFNDMVLKVDRLLCTFATMPTDHRQTDMECSMFCLKLENYYPYV